MTYEPKLETYIPIEQCVVGALYQVSARNFNIGIYRGGKSRCFTGLSFSFGQEYLETEYHWDNGPPYGTVKPMRFVEQSPFMDLSCDVVHREGADSITIFAWLESKVKEYPQGD